jgi:hypothetical protein
MREITLSGTFYEMGRQYGALRKGRIKSFLFMTRLMAVASEGEGRGFFRPRYRHMLSGLFQMGRYQRTYRTVAEQFEANIARHYPEILDMIKRIMTCASIVLSPRDRSMTVYEGNPCHNHARNFTF